MTPLLSSLIYLNSVELKIFFGGLASVLLILGFIPYFQDIFKKQTKPHIYTWLIWSITQGTALAALITGEGGAFASLGVASSALLTMFVFFLSFKFGTKDITRSDTLTLVAALTAVLVWWQLNNPYIAVLMVAIIDSVGYIPTYRKLWNQPWSETLSFWYLFTGGNIFALLAIEQYNFLTASYLVAVTIASVALIVLSHARRSVI